MRASAAMWGEHMWPQNGEEIEHSLFGKKKTKKCPRFPMEQKKTEGEEEEHNKRQK
jgi:hypothetical protein